MSKDIHKIRPRLENQIHLLLKDMEDNPQVWSSRERLAVIQHVGGYLMRQTKFGDEYVPAPTGATVRKYSGAFQTTNATGGRTSRTRPALVPAFSGDDDPDDTAA